MIKESRTNEKKNMFQIQFSFWSWLCDICISYYYVFVISYYHYIIKLQSAKGEVTRECGDEANRNKVFGIACAIDRWRFEWSIAVIAWIIVWIRRKTRVIFLVVVHLENIINWTLLTRVKWLYRHSRIWEPEKKQERRKMNIPCAIHTRPEYNRTIRSRNSIFLLNHIVHRFIKEEKKNIIRQALTQSYTNTNHHTAINSHFIEYNAVASYWWPFYQT